MIQSRDAHSTKKLLLPVLAWACMAQVGAQNSTAVAQQIDARPVRTGVWSGFDADFTPSWSGQTKQVNWTPPPNPSYGAVTTYSGAFTFWPSSPPPPPKPIELLRATQRSFVDSWASAMGVTANSTTGGDFTSKNLWSNSQGRYAEIVNLQNVLLNRGASASQLTSNPQDTSFVAEGRVQASTLVENSLIATTATYAVGESLAAAVYLVREPMRFNLSGTLAGEDWLLLDFKLDNQRTGQSLYSLKPAPTAAGQSWDFALQGILEPGEYGMSISAKAQAAASAEGVRFGGQGEFSLAFEATPVFTGDFNSDGHANRTDFNLWKTSFGYGSAADVDGDADTDGRDFLVWQRGAAPVGPAAASIAMGDAARFRQWKQGFGVTHVADGDNDGDADGQDFLAWQRKANFSTMSTAAAAPEPATWALAAAAGGFLLAARRR